MKILNLGCETKTSDSPDVINVDWTIYLRMKKNPLLRLLAPLFFKGERWERFSSIPSNIVVYNLEKGIPFDSDSVDFVYHSHLLEHLDRDVVEDFLREVKRVLKPGGVQRIVVPDFEKGCRAYLTHLELCEREPGEREGHDVYIAALIEQSVRKESWLTSRQRPIRRFMENILMGDARKRGQTHQWAYDRVNLTSILVRLGYRDVEERDYRTSLLHGWNAYGLDVDGSGRQYKPGSLYVEAVK